jgi:hypothetical protein
MAKKKPMTIRGADDSRQGENQGDRRAAAQCDQLYDRRR